jgi:hypothetical protein
MINIILKLFIRALKVANLLDDNVNAAIAELPNNYVVKIVVLPNNNYVYCKISEGTIYRITDDKLLTPDLIIEFKDKKSALQTFLGKMSVSQAFCEHRIKVYGNINHAVIITRAINIVETYLYPQFITKKLFTPLPKLQHNKLKFYFKLLF